MTKEEELNSLLKRALAFVCVDNDGVYDQIGTGFFCKLTLEKNPKRYTCYFVTAKHVLQKNNEFLDTIYLRLNTKNDSVDYLPLDLSNGVFTHDDSAVDLVVIPCLPSKDKFDYALFPADHFDTGTMFENFPIIEGDGCFFAGLFLPHKGYKKNVPIFHHGYIALITDDKISWIDETEKIPVLTKLHLIDCHTFSGNSGSPVFFIVHPKLEDEEIPKGPPWILFGGVVRGSFMEKNTIEDTSTIYPPSYSENQRITAVTPAFQLREILFSSELVEQRVSLANALPTEN